MRIDRLTVENFRSYEKESVVPDPEVTVFYGENARGKTNLLEAVFLCCTARSHRTARENELVRFDCEKAEVGAGIRKLNGETRIDLTIPQKGKKTAAIGGMKLDRIAELLGTLNGVLFSPEDLRLVKDGPEMRRRFMDISLSQVSPVYLHTLASYMRALKQRNGLIRQIALGQEKEALLSVWDEQLAKYGADLIRRRIKWTDHLNETAGAIYADISSGRERFDIDYQCHFEASDELEQVIYDFLNQKHEEDLRRGTTLYGPHRDELMMKINGFPMRAFASQGQQRTGALSLKLAELRMMEEATGDSPILLLDDVMSELDSERQKMLIRHTGGVQTLIACTDADLLPSFAGRSCAIYRIGMQNGISHAEKQTL